jgi:DNA-binding XRE family transcriptional regulator
MKMTCPHCGEVFFTGPNNPLRLARLEKDFSIPAASREVGVSEWTLVRLEKGQGIPTLEQARNFARVYGKTMDELFPPPADSTGSTESAEGETDE